jgi:hypothetical protein
VKFAIDCRLTFAFRCSQPGCLSTEAVAVDAMAYDAVPIPDLPERWHVLDGRAICAEHRIIVESAQLEEASR